jgi:photosystem II stability/assembly factor-like uncharacterized protein
MKRFIAIILFAALALVQAGSSRAQWVPTADLMVGRFTAFTADSLSNIFAVANGRVYFNDAPQSRLSDANALISNKDLSGNSFTLVSTWNHGVFKTSGNQPWQADDSGLTLSPVRAFAALPGTSKGMLLFAGTEWKGVYVSTDFGASWTASNTGIETSDISSLGGNGATLLAGTHLGMYRSSDRGASWQQVNIGISEPQQFAFLSDINSIVSIGSKYFIGLSTLHYPGTLYPGGVFVSNDDGQSWTQIDNGLVDTNVNALAVVGNKLFAATTSGVFVTTDDGANWELTNNNLPVAAVYGLFYHDQSLFAGSQDGLYESLDQGKSWNLHPVQSGAGAYSLKCLATDGSALFVGTGDNANDTGYGLYKSTDEGGSWTSVNNGLPPQSIVSGLAILGSNIFCGTSRDFFSIPFDRIDDGGLFVSSDDGDSWQRAPGWPSKDSNAENFGMLGGILFASGWSDISVGLNFDRSSFIFRSTDSG